jgi:hypothetical protein
MRAMKKLTVVVMSVIICTKIIISVFAQEAATRPSDLRVCFAFLSFQNALAKEIESRMVSDPDSGNSLRNAAIGMLKVDPGDFDVISLVASSAIAKLGMIREETLRRRQAVTKKRHKQDFELSQEFQTKRSEVILSAMTQLQARLSKSGRRALQKYLTEEFSKTVRKELHQ